MKGYYTYTVVKVYGKDLWMVCWNHMGVSGLSRYCKTEEEANRWAAIMNS